MNKHDAGKWVDANSLTVSQAKVFVATASRDVPSRVNPILGRDRVLQILADGLQKLAEKFGGDHDLCRCGHEGHRLTAKNIVRECM